MAVLTGPLEPPEDYVLLGQLGKTFGLEGALRFRPLGGAEQEAVLALDEVFVTGLGVAQIREVRRHGNGLVIFFEAVKRPERARRLVNAEVFAARDSLPPPDGERAYLQALTGRPVLVDGRPIGTVLELGGVDGAELLVVERPQGDELLIPLRAPYVQVVEDAVLVADPPPGLLDPRESA